MCAREFDYFKGYVNVDLPNPRYFQDGGILKTNVKCNLDWENICYKISTTINIEINKYDFIDHFKSYFIIVGFYFK